jgi:hypothetical protein
MKNEGMLHELQQNLQDAKGNLHVLDASVPVEKQIAYFKYSKYVRDNSSENESVKEQIEKLLSPETTPEEAKYAMTFLAISGDVSAYRTLETLSKDPQNQPPNDWLVMSLLQARITLDSKFSDERQIYIASGLGGAGNKMRLFAFFKSEGLRPFTDYQRNLISKEFPFQIRRYQGEVEEIQINDTYFSVLFLLDLQVNLKNILPVAINECNEYGHFIQTNFIVTNEKKFNADDILRELQQ